MNLFTFLSVSVKILAMSTTYKPSKVKRAKKHGFLSRKKTSSGKKVLLRRMRKGRKALTVSNTTYKKRV